MKDIPIIMSAPMVRACLREVEKPGTGKTETRRLAWGEEVRVPYELGLKLRAKGWHARPMPAHSNEFDVRRPTPWQRVKPGDRLWVRETWRASYVWEGYDEKLGRVRRPSDITPGSIVEYLADQAVDDMPELGGKTRVAIHMPRWASRLTLIVKATKIERLLDISEASARAEGIQQRIIGVHDNTDAPPESMAAYAVDFDDGGACYTARHAFLLLWTWLHGAESRRANPEVVAITFTPHLVNIDAMPKAEAA